MMLSWESEMDTQTIVEENGHSHGAVILECCIHNTLSLS